MGAMAQPHTHSFRTVFIALLVVSALLWLVAVLPVFLIGIGMGGLTVWEGVNTTWQNAGGGDPISLAMLLLTASLVGLPWAVWSLIKER
jgi:hypothetical protein